MTQSGLPEWAEPTFVAIETFYRRSIESVIHEPERIALRRELFDGQREFFRLRDRLVVLNLRVPGLLG
jgi:predicted methyltransferase